VIEVTVPGYSGRAKRRGINLHRSRTLLPAYCTIRHGIPVTRPARTLEDLRCILSAKEFAAALREAEFLGLPVGDHFATAPAPSWSPACSPSAAVTGCRSRR
jgi:hypothetical protein